jgi:2-oxoglutarate dehydrogenase E2 component (dihydrolipoamide succinyltransferase)
MKGGTFTISNGGVFGSLLSSPIINPPQSAVLGMHRIEERRSSATARSSPGR